MRKATFTLARPLLGVFTAILCLFSINIYSQQQFDVALTKTTVTTGPVQYGTSIPFNFTIYNQGLDTITNVEIIDHFGDGLEFQGVLNPTWSAHTTILNAVTTTYTQMIPPGESRIVTLNMIARPGDSFDDWHNVGEVVTFTDVNGVDRESEDMDSNGNEDPTDDAGGLLGSPADNYITGDGTGFPNDGVAATDEDDHDRDSIQIFDLALTKILDPITGYSYGDTLTFNVMVYNQGNMEARVVRVRDIIPEGYIYPVAENMANGWSSDPVNPINTISSIDPFDSLEITIKLILGTIAVDENAWNNYSEIIYAEDTAFNNVGILDADSTPGSNTPGERSVLPGDPDDNNIGNSSTNPGDEDDHDPAAPVVFDLAIIKERSTALSSFNYGTPIEYTYTLQNQGNVDATDIVLYDSLPCGAMFTVTPENAGWNYNPSTRIATRTIDSLAAATQVQGTLTLTVMPCTIDQETAWTNYIEISSATTVDGVQSIEIDGVFDTNLQNDPGGIPLTSSDNNLNGLGIIDEDNHDVELLQVYDLALKKELITPGPYTEGQELDFRIRVYNQGNIVIQDLVVEDFIPEGYGYDPVVNAPLGWTNSYSTIVGGVPTVFPDTLNVMEDIFLATEDSIDIFIKLTLELDGTDISDWYNFAHIWVAKDTVGNNRFDDADSNPFTTIPLEFAVIPGSPNDNNIFSMGKSVTPHIEEDDHDVANVDYFDLTLTKNLPAILPTSYNEDVTFEIIVKNEGVQFAHDIIIVDYLPCGFEFDEGSNTNWFENLSTGNPEYFYTDTLYAGEQVIIPITLRLVECQMIDGNSWRNISEIEDALDDSDMTGDDQDSTPDDDSSNEPNGEDDVNDALIDVFDLTLSKTVVNPQGTYELDDNVTYEITITNQGNVVASDIDVIDYIPCGMTLSPTSSGWTIDGNGYANTTIAGPLNPGTSTVVSITLTIESCANETGLRNNIAEITEANNPSGPSGDFDSTPDNNPGNDLDDEDDIDDVEIAVSVGARIGDFVFNDYDGDGIQDGGEPGISGVMVILYDVFDSVIAVTETNAGGIYEFLDIPAGDYYVVFNQDNENLSPTLPNTGNNANDSNITGENGPGSTAVFTLVAGQDDLTIDGGFFQCLDIKGVTYYDVNEDDIRQSTENGINGLITNLYRRLNGSWILWDSETTHHDFETPSDDGIWDFCVPPGEYYIEIEMPPIGLVRVRPFIGGSNYDSDINGANGPNTTPTFVLNPGGSKTDLGAGYYPMATVGNRVWFDDNANGIQEQSEPIAQGINVQVYNMANELIDEALTDEHGLYKVEYLQKEEYYLKFEVPEGLSFTLADISDNEEIDSDVTHAMGINTTDPIAFNPGDKINHVDAGIISGVLPLIWKNFYVEKYDKFHSLNWTTSSELNVSHFDVERRLESETDFYSIGEVSAVGNSLKEQFYSYADNDITENGIYYYRIMEVDIDGKSSYSEIISVRKADREKIFNYPNPASQIMNLEGLYDDETYIVKIVDATGVVVKSNSLTGAISHKIDISNLSSGSYELLVVYNDDILYQNRFIKIE